jgi:hypothetical protein
MDLPTAEEFIASGAADAVAGGAAGKTGFQDTGEPKPCPRADSEEPAYAVFAWSRH